MSALILQESDKENHGMIRNAMSTLSSMNSNLVLKANHARAKAFSYRQCLTEALDILYQDQQLDSLEQKQFNAFAKSIQEEQEVILLVLKDLENELASKQPDISLTRDLVSTIKDYLQSSVKKKENSIKAFNNSKKERMEKAKTQRTELQEKNQILRNQKMEMLAIVSSYKDSGIDLCSYSPPVTREEEEESDKNELELALHEMQTKMQMEQLKAELSRAQAQASEKSHELLIEKQLALSRENKIIEEKEAAISELEADILRFREEAKIRNKELDELKTAQAAALENNEGRFTSLIPVENKFNPGNILPSPHRIALLSADFLLGSAESAAAAAADDSTERSARSSLTEASVRAGTIDSEIGAADVSVASDAGEFDLAQAISPSPYMQRQAATIPSSSVAPESGTASTTASGWGGNQFLHDVEAEAEAGAHCSSEKEAIENIEAARSLSSPVNKEEIMVAAVTPVSISPSGRIRWVRSSGGGSVGPTSSPSFPSATAITDIVGASSNKVITAQYQNVASASSPLASESRGGPVSASNSLTSESFFESPLSLNSASGTPTGSPLKASLSSPIVYGDGSGRSITTGRVEQESIMLLPIIYPDVAQPMIPLKSEKRSRVSPSSSGEALASVDISVAKAESMEASVTASFTSSPTKTKKLKTSVNKPTSTTHSNKALSTPEKSRGNSIGGSGGWKISGKYNSLGCDAYSPPSTEGTVSQRGPASVSSGSSSGSALLGKSPYSIKARNARAGVSSSGKTLRGVEVLRARPRQARFTPSSTETNDSALIDSTGGTDAGKSIAGDHAVGTADKDSISLASVIDFSAEGSSAPTLEESKAYTAELDEAKLALARREAECNQLQHDLVRLVDQLSLQKDRHSQEMDLLREEIEHCRVLSQQKSDIQAQCIMSLEEELAAVRSQLKRVEASKRDVEQELNKGVSEDEKNLDSVTATAASLDSLTNSSTSDAVIARAGGNEAADQALAVITLKSRLIAAEELNDRLQERLDVSESMVNVQDRTALAPLQRHHRYNTGEECQMCFSVKEFKRSAPRRERIVKYTNADRTADSDDDDRELSELRLRLVALATDNSTLTHELQAKQATADALSLQLLTVRFDFEADVAREKQFIVRLEEELSALRSELDQTEAKKRDTRDAETLAAVMQQRDELQSLLTAKTAVIEVVSQQRLKEQEEYTRFLDDRTRLQQTVSDLQSDTASKTTSLDAAKEELIAANDEMAVLVASKNQLQVTLSELIAERDGLLAASNSSIKQVALLMDEKAVFDAASEVYHAKVADLEASVAHLNIVIAELGDENNRIKSELDNEAGHSEVLSTQMSSLNEQLSKVVLHAELIDLINHGAGEAASPEAQEALHAYIAKLHDDTRRLKNELDIALIDRENLKHEVGSLLERLSPSARTSLVSSSAQNGEEEELAEEERKMARELPSEVNEVVSVDVVAFVVPPESSALTSMNEHSLQQHHILQSANSLLDHVSRASQHSSALMSSITGFTDHTGAMSDDEEMNEIRARFLEILASRGESQLAENKHKMAELVLAEHQNDCDGTDMGSEAVVFSKLGAAMSTWKQDLSLRIRSLEEELTDNRGNNGAVDDISAYIARFGAVVDDFVTSHPVVADDAHHNKDAFTVEIANMISSEYADACKLLMSHFVSSKHVHANPNLERPKKSDTAIVHMTSLLGTHVETDDAAAVNTSQSEATSTM